MQTMDVSKTYVLAPLTKRECVAEAILAYLVLYQAQRIGRVDGMPTDATVLHNVVFGTDNCDISWSYRVQKYVIACPSWVKLVDLTGAVSKEYSLSGTEGLIFHYEWQPTRELFYIRTSPTNYIVLDQDFNLVRGNTSYDFVTEGQWFQDGSAAYPYPAIMIEDSFRRVSSTYYLWVVRTVNWADITIDAMSGAWMKQVDGQWVGDDGTWPKDIDGNLTSTQDLHIVDGRVTTPEYYWRPDYLHSPYTGAQVRLYNIATGVSTVIHTLAAVDCEFVNTVAFDTCDGIYEQGGGGFYPPISA
jgi:hypothetical protein